MQRAILILADSVRWYRRSELLVCHLATSWTPDLATSWTLNLTTNYPDQQYQQKLSATNFPSTPLRRHWTA
jgi:hypothetical protein